MVHVAYLCEYTTLNGGENSLLAFLAGVQDRIRATILCPETGPLADELRIRGLEHIPLEFHQSNGTRKPPELLVDEVVQTVRKLKVDLVHANSLSMCRLLGLSAGHLPCPTVGHIRDIMQVSAKVVSDLNQLDQLIAVSEAARVAFIEQGVSADRVSRIYNGVDIHRFQAKIPRPDSWRRKLNLPRHARLIGGVGQIGLRKGWCYLCDAVEPLMATFPDLHVLIAGERYSQKPESQQYESDLRQRAMSGPLAGHLHMPGYVSNMPALLQELDVLAHAALQEPLGRVLLEAAASSLPVVATEVGGTPEIFTSTGAWLVPPHESKRLSEALMQSLISPAIADSKAKIARRRIEEHFNLSHFQEKTVQIYRKCLGL
ncbi:MAG: glycosyltransferase family 4 protein [Planctomycetota bacterium]|nr:glycosyltransferase family 4 protein [Planctomycetota bacterium]